MTDSVVSGTSKELLKKLEEWQKKERLSSGFFEFYKKLLGIQVWAEDNIKKPKPKIPKQAAHQRILNGTTLLRFDELDLDWSLVDMVFTKVVETFIDYPDLLGETPQRLRKLQTGLSREVVEAWLKGTRLPKKIYGSNIDTHLLEALVQATMKPFLVNYAKALIDFVDQEKWRRGYCPICGGVPDFAFLEKEVGARWLICSRCETQWLFQRLECPYCGNKDHNSLSYFRSDDDLYRLYLCHNCRTYLKAIDLRKTDKKVFLLLERLLTLAMDRQGQEQGYHPAISEIGGLR